AGLVVGARVDDAAVVPRLMRGDARLLVDDHAARAGISLGQRERGREPDDASPDDGDVRCPGHGGPQSAASAPRESLSRPAAPRSTRRRPRASPRPPAHRSVPSRSPALGRRYACWMALSLKRFGPTDRTNVQYSSNFTGSLVLPSSTRLPLSSVV